MPLDQDLNAEIASHLGLAIEENMRRGMSVEEARRPALIRFGGIEQAKERQRETRGLPVPDVLGAGSPFCFSQVALGPGFCNHSHEIEIFECPFYAGTYGLVRAVVRTRHKRPNQKTGDQRQTFPGALGSAGSPSMTANPARRSALHSSPC